MSRRYGVLVLGIIWLQCGCEFRDELNVEATKLTTTDLTFSWGDSAGSHEIVRSFEVDAASLSGALTLPMSSLPQNLTVQGLEPGGEGCGARLWVNGESLVKLDCIALQGSKELTVRGLDIAVPPNMDGLHTVRVEAGSQSINFSVRTLPSAIPFSSVARTVSTKSVGLANSYHQVAAFEIKRGTGGAMTAAMPTKVSGNLRRKRIVHDYNWDSLLCELALTTYQADIDKTVEVLLVPDDSELATEWPLLFSLDTQLFEIPKERSARVLVFIADPFLDKVYGPGDFREHSYATTVSEWCQDRTIGPRPIPSRGIYDVDLNVRAGWDESDPQLTFTIATVQVFDAESFIADKKPVAAAIAPQNFSLTLSRDVP